jgi:hypothetical protein
MALPRVSPAALPISQITRQRAVVMQVAGFLVLALSACIAQSQSADRLPQSFDPAPAQVLTGHHPQWASSANDTGTLDPSMVIDNLTMVLARSPEQEKAFEQLLADQQNPGSPQYHHWLTPVEIGTRFGLSDHDIASISGWLESQGLHVNWVAPSKIFIMFGGTAASLGHAFGTPMHSYKVNGDDRISVVSDPMVPSALAPAILAVRGLYTVKERPQHNVRVESVSTPEITLTPGNYVIGPADFARIYDLPSSLTGSGVNIGIVGEAHVDPADITEFQSLLGSGFTTPTQVVPTAQGGVDPGAAYTAPPACATATPPNCTNAVNDYIDAQGEATLDVTRAGSIAPGANVVLVTAASNSTGSQGIYTDAQYIIATTTSPGPFQVMSISFGGCEADGGPSDVNAWGSIYQTAAGEGISVFVSSGDSGAAGCDAHGAAPPAVPTAASPNALCSPAYETCVGGTEFNDAGDFAAYWDNGSKFPAESAMGYIPEGAWNEPGTAPSALQVAATGGGVSQYIPTPSWQTGTGVPAAKAGRYTPDVSFTASGHDAYFACLAVAGGDCVNTPQGVPFVEFSGTSASAPDMAGIAALLDQQMGSGQGNLDPAIYSLAASSPAAFHDVTVSSSGVTSCSLGTPSMCNNSIAGHTTLTGGTKGYLLQTGYDEVTGWGSLDVSTFVQDYFDTYSLATPGIQVTPNTSPLKVNQSLNVAVVVQNASGRSTPTGSVTLTSGTYTSSPATLISGSVQITIPANSLAVGNDTVTATYTPDSASSGIYTTSNNSAQVTVVPASPSTPVVTFQPLSGPVTIGQTVWVTANVSSVSGCPLPDGGMVLSSGSYSSPAGPTSNGVGTAFFPADSLPVGTDAITMTFTPTAGSVSAFCYNSASGAGIITVDPMQNTTVTVSPSPANINQAQSLQVNVTMSSATGFPAPQGSVTLSGGGYKVTLSGVTGGVASFTIAPEVLPAGPNTLTANYLSNDGIYNNATGSVTITVAAAPDFTLSAPSDPVSVPLGTTGSGTITINPLNSFNSSIAFTASGLPDGITATFAAGTAANTETVTFTAATSAPMGNFYITVTGVSGSITRTATVNLNVTPEPSFGPAPGTGTANISVVPGATTGNTATIGVVGTNGFTGTVTLSCMVASSPQNAAYPPTCAFNPSTVTISGSAVQTSTLAINTTAASSALNQTQKSFWPTTGTAALALVLFLIVPRRRRNWLALVALLVLFVAAGLTACGGGGGAGGGGGGGGIAGTTTGTYGIYVTGSSGSQAGVAISTVALTVN